MVFPDDHPDSKLRGQAKGVKVVLQERKSVWDKYMKVCWEHGTKVIGSVPHAQNCKCTKMQSSALHWLRRPGQDGIATAEDAAAVDLDLQPTPDDEWCCMHRCPCITGGLSI